MEWTTILTEIFKVCVIPLLGVLTAFVVAWIKSKINNINAKTNNELLRTAVSVGRIGQ